MSRRRFTREFKLAALQRLEMGASVAEVARAAAAQNGQNEPHYHPKGASAICG